MCWPCIAVYDIDLKEQRFNDASSAEVIIVFTLLQIERCHVGFETAVGQFLGEWKHSLI